ncbi:hypothetical protein [Bacillus ndiopicus]|uniref:hypothetical protein n=1 Tax=Bacillus ndiopicus TaxID=1347368 RepID=UPI0005AAB395|nr:hypothetical protein [Bacillus ndiopicus]
MKSFLALFQKEWVVVRGNVFVLLVVGPLLVLGVPYIIDKNVETSMGLNELIIMFLFFAISLGVMATPTQYITSIRMDVNRKEVWLHSPQSIYCLLGAKALFSICMFIIFTFVVFCSGFIMVSAQLEWPIFKAFIASIAMTISLTGLQLLILAYMHVFYIFYLQLKCYIGKLAVVITVPFAIFVGYILTKIEDSAWFRAIVQHGYISLEPIENYLQPSNHDVFFYVGSIYLVQLVFYALCITVLFIVSSKWLEKVVSQS